MLSPGSLILVAVGSAMGGMLRFWLGLVIDRRWPAQLPWGTVIVNISGALIIGALGVPLGLFDDGRLSLPAALLVTGFLGSYTTVSAFGLQTLVMLRQGALSRAILHVLLSVFGCLMSAVAGMLLARLLVSGGGGP